MEEAGVRPAPPPAWTPLQTWVCVILAALATAALVANAALAWRAQDAPALDPGPRGQWYSVQLVSGQVYYGVLLEARPGFIKLGNVYYTQAYTQPDGQPGNRVVNRAKTDWHGPQAQLIPVEKILLVEAVGEQSPLARLIAQDQLKK